MIKFLMVILALFSGFCSAGVTVLGTRFVFKDDMKSLNIKLMNDDENDFLIKAKVNSNDFFVTPPAFILNKNRSNVISIIPDGLKSSDKDQVYSLTVTAIPKSSMSDNSNVVSLAVRSHFNLVHIHRLAKKDDVEKVIVSTARNGEIQVKNTGSVSFLIEGLDSAGAGTSGMKLLGPDKTLTLDKNDTKGNAIKSISLSDVDGRLLTNVKSHTG